MRVLRVLGFVAMAMLAGCGEVQTRGDGSRILAMGDSLLAWHGATGHAVSDRLEHHLGEPVIDRSVVGARMIYHLPVSGAMGLSIPQQYRADRWDWVVLNGGGNDLWLGCGCTACDHRLNKMITKDGQGGEIPHLVRRMREMGSRVLFVGYLRSPGFGSPIEHCRNEGAAFDARLAAMAKADPGVEFLSLADLVPEGDKSYHALDRIHPSRKGSEAIARRIADVIRRTR
ncbi:MAG: SGNH/GDSL hydrolase family protein [Pseudomonadota bacterium]